MDVTELSAQIIERLDEDTDNLFAALFETLGEDHALPQDPVEAGRRAFYAAFERLRGKICADPLMTQIRGDFNRSGPIVAALLAEDAYFSQHDVQSCVYLGALIVKLGVDRLCDDGL